MQDAVLKLLVCVFVMIPWSHSIDTSSRDMKSVYDKCKPILQIYGTSNETLFTMIKQEFDAWRSRNNLEERIRNLRDLAKQCREQFMVRKHPIWK